ncbi:MAG: hypothetical protein KJO54_04520 [Gammaproteobacteria bacterium]|nr:hypothetical protein [Gammaproteobacteria bacterium]NNF61001.1 hypothetical protein [Gammaproteobacteria bacterium]NNM21085.1 hypothetical protein [Gammaproteobacteria bacterium]
MKRLVVIAALMAVAAGAQAYSIKHSYSGENKSIEYYGACDSGQLIKITEHSDGRFSFEGPAGSGTLRGRGSLDKAAAAACGE